jgi:hypothetical protein
MAQAAATMMTLLAQAEVLETVMAETKPQDMVQLAVMTMKAVVAMGAATGRLVVTTSDPLVKTRMAASESVITTTRRRI